MRQFYIRKWFKQKPEEYELVENKNLIYLTSSTCSHKFKSYEEVEEFLITFNFEKKI